MRGGSPNRMMRAILSIFLVTLTSIGWGATNYVSGPTLGYITRIAPPRAVRIGVGVEF